MGTNLADFLDRLRTSLWFLPGMIAAGSVLLAIGAIALDARYGGDWVREVRWLSTGEAAGSRAILSTIAGSMITVVGVTFSITVVALSLASQQFGPRLLRNFMRDRANQVVLGAFIGTFLYCAVVLRVVQSGDGAAGVPYLAVTLGVVLTLVSLALFIYFIHHVAVSIQADHIIGGVRNELDSTIRRLYRVAIDSEPTETRSGDGRACDLDSPLPAEFESESAIIPAKQTGYVRAIDLADSMKLAVREDVVIEFVYRPGDFVVEALPIARIWPPQRATGDLIELLYEQIVVGRQRSAEQDVEFSVNQLVEVALRALSPSTNDAFTAISCIDNLSAALCLLGSRAIPSRYRCDDAGRVRLVLDQPDFRGVVDAAFNQIRQNARDNAAVTIRLLDAIARAVERLHDYKGRVDPLLKQAQMIVRGALEALPEDFDRRAVKARYEKILRLLETRPQPEHQKAASR